MPDGLAVECRAVHKAYGATHALAGLDATFLPGQVNALLGPSGRGKSTLLRLLAGVEGADGGSIRVGDTNLNTLRGAAVRAHRKAVVTLVLQRAGANLVPHARLREQLPSGATGLLGELGLEGRLDARASQLSGGEQARAALALALARQTPVVLLDEPTAELDRDTAALVIDLLRAEAARGTTVVVATHDADLRAAADSVLDLAEDAYAPGHDRGDAPRHPGARVLRVDGLTKRYGPTLAVDEATLELRAGETGVVLGRSGSGKSTLLMILGGWIEPDAGRIDGPATDWVDMGYVPQRFGLLPELTIAENAALPARVAGERQDVSELLGRLGLAAVADHLPDEASIGQQQRAALARALARRPVLLLADEPTSHQDARSAELVWAAIDDACARGTACLVATHDTAVADRGDRVWQIAGGRLADVAASTP